MGKSSKLAFVPRNFNALHPLDMLHLDVWGPAPVYSMNGHRFYLSIVDDFSRYVWSFPLFHKSNVTDVFSTFKTQIENQLSRKIAAVHSVEAVQN